MSIISNFIDTKHGRLAYKAFKGDPDKPGVLFLGGFASSMAGTKASFLLDRGVQVGQSTVVFDYMGHGDSDGRFQDGTISIWLQNALDVLDNLTEGPQIVVGSSMGGWLMLLLAVARPKRVCRMVGLASAPGFTEDMWHYRLEEADREKMKAEGVIEKVMGEDTYQLSYALIQDGRKFLLEDLINYRCPLFLVHGVADLVVPWSVSAGLLAKARAPMVNLTLVKDGDHRLNRPEDLALLEKLICPDPLLP